MQSVMRYLTHALNFSQDTLSILCSSWNCTVGRDLPGRGTHKDCDIKLRESGILGKIISLQLHQVDNSLNGQFYVFQSSVTLATAFIFLLTIFVVLHFVFVSWLCNYFENLWHKRSISYRRVSLNWNSSYSLNM